MILLNTMDVLFRCTVCFFLALAFHAGDALRLEFKKIENLRISKSKLHCMYNYTAGKALFEHLTTDMNRYLRPTNLVAVNITFNVLSIKYMDVKSQTFAVAGLLGVSWFDPQATWHPENFNGIKFFFLTQNHFWKPELVIANSITDLSAIQDSELLIRAEHTGRMVWEPPGIYETYCNVDVTYYPFDTQECVIAVSSWAYDIDIIETLRESNQILLHEYSENAEWALENTRVSTGKKAIDGGFSRFMIQFIFNLKRKTKYYILSFIIPLVLMALLGHIVFLLPPESGEKIGFSLTVLLAFTVLLTILSGTIPSTSNTTSLLGVYIAINIIISAAEVIATVIVIRCHHKHEKGVPVSYTTQRFTRTTLARISCTSCGLNKQNGKVNPTTYERNQKKTVEPRDTLPEVDTQNYTWIDIADMLDRLFLLLFSLMSTVISLYFINMISSADTEEGTGPP